MNTKSTKKIPLLLVLMVLLGGLILSCRKKEKIVYENTADIPANREMVAELTAPPHVPTPVGDRKAKLLKVDMEILDQEGEMTNGVRYI